MSILELEVTIVSGSKQTLHLSKHALQLKVVTLPQTVAMMAITVIFTTNVQTQTVSLVIEMAMVATSMQIIQTGAETMIQMSSTPCRCAALVVVEIVKVKTMEATMVVTMVVMMVATMMATIVAMMVPWMKLTACACVMPQTLTAGENASSASMTFLAMKMSSMSQYLSLNQKVLLVRNSATNAHSRIWIAGKNAISALTHISVMKKMAKEPLKKVKVKVKANLMNANAIGKMTPAGMHATEMKSTEPLLLMA